MGEIKSIPIRKIIVTEDNPRQTFDKESLIRLGQSIKTHGLIQPIVVRPREDYYELVVGERRLRAVELIGMKEIEARIEEIDDATLMELRLIENTQREDLTNAEKGDAVLTLWERYPEKYPTIKSIAEAIKFSHATVKNWIAKSERLSPKVNESIARNTLTERAAQSLLKYDHETQEKLADAIIKYDIRGGREGAERRFIRLYDENPDADLKELAEKAKGVEIVHVPLKELSKEAREEVEQVLGEKEKEAEERRKKAREKARKAPRRVRPKITKRVEHYTDSVLSKAEELKAKLEEVEPIERERLAKSVGERLDYLAKKVELQRQIEEDEELREMLKKWRANVVHKVSEETPVRFVKNFEELLHGIWTRIGVEYPTTVKDIGRRELVKALPLDQLESLQETLRMTIKELEEFQSVLDAELFTRRTKK
jgi:ParB family chromosome partitioning protein